MAQDWQPLTAEQIQEQAQSYATPHTPICIRKDETKETVIYQLLRDSKHEEDFEILQEYIFPKQTQENVCSNLSLIEKCFLNPFEMGITRTFILEAK